MSDENVVLLLKQRVLSLETQLNSLEILIKNHITCSCCRTTIVIPTSLECGHVFCSDCIFEQETCPECHHRITTRFPVPNLQIFVQKIAKFKRKHEFVTVQKPLIRRVEWRRKGQTPQRRSLRQSSAPARTNHASHQIEQTVKRIKLTEDTIRSLSVDLD